MAAGVNPVNIFIREGRNTRFPFIPGMDVAGVVDELETKCGETEQRLAVYAYLSFEEQGGAIWVCGRKPRSCGAQAQVIDFEKAAAVPLAATSSKVP